MIDNPTWCSISRAAETMDVSRQYAHRLITENPDRFKTLRAGRKALLVDEADVNDYQAKRQSQYTVLDPED